MAAPVVSSGTGTLSQKGTVTPDPPPGPRLNPYVDPGPWQFVDIGGVRIPGLVVSIDGAEKPEEWSVQKGTGSSGATTVWKGTKLAESMTLVVALPNAAAVESYYIVRDTLRPKLGTKPPSLIVANAAINFAGITRVACIDVSPPKWVASGGYWTGTIKIIEYNPSKPTNAGPASAAKAKASAPDPNQDVKDALQATLNEAKAA